MSRYRIHDWGWLWPIGIVLAIGGAIFGLAYCFAQVTIREHQTAYGAWCEQTGITNLTFQQWDSLRSAGALSSITGGK